MVADYDEARSRRAVDALDDDRFVAAQIDASDAASVEALAREHRITHVMNAVDPRFVMPIFDGAFAAGADYLDMAMSLSKPHPERPYEECGVKLGDEQFAKAGDWERRGPARAGRHRRRAGALRRVRPLRRRPPVLRDRRARHPRRREPRGDRRRGNEIFAPSFSIWTTIEECLNPPVIWEKDRGWFTTAPFSEPEVFDFPEGIGPVECVNVEHEEVLLMPRWVDCQRATFKYGLGDEFIDVLKMLHTLGLDSTEKVRVEGRRGESRATSSRPACPTRRRWATQMTRQDLRRPVRHRHRQGRPAAVDVPLPRGRQRVVDERVRPPVRGLADRGQPGGGPRAARHRRRGRAAACSVRRPSTRCRSSTCSPSTAAPGAAGRRTRGLTGAVHRGG